MKQILKAFIMSLAIIVGSEALNSATEAKNAVIGTVFAPHREMVPRFHFFGRTLGQKTKDTVKKHENVTLKPFGGQGRFLFQPTTSGTEYVVQKHSDGIFYVIGEIPESQSSSDNLTGTDFFTQTDTIKNLQDPLKQAAIGEASSRKNEPKKQAEEKERKEKEEKERREREEKQKREREERERKEKEDQEQEEKEEQERKAREEGSWKCWACSRQNQINAQCCSLCGVEKDPPKTKRIKEGKKNAQCNFCYHQNPIGSEFCTICGAPTRGQLKKNQQRRKKIEREKRKQEEKVRKERDSASNAITSALQQFNLSETPTEEDIAAVVGGKNAVVLAKEKAKAKVEGILSWHKIQLVEGTQLDDETLKAIIKLNSQDSEKEEKEGGERSGGQKSNKIEVGIRELLGEKCVPKVDDNPSTQETPAAASTRQSQTNSSTAPHWLCNTGNNILNPSNFFGYSALALFPWATLRAYRQALAWGIKQGMTVYGAKARAMRAEVLLEFMKKDRVGQAMFICSGLWASGKFLAFLSPRAQFLNKPMFGLHSFGKNQS
ncbi:hypothetical protein ACFLY6_01285 [Candidatus Dependentiae bacterium]